ncbi:hypothetical protein SHKM778_28360 [Streptomyces sp. KM77-8]|uniref:Carrier domain-containing protein n=1 Tax=Streptomyces haneummycinicus TaxID=3074435 RepID=A0AAT9HGP6_9ACTN
MLDRLTADRDLDLFLGCSSVSAAIGNPGQAAYAAANAHLEALVRARRAAGRTGTALAWGPIGETGYVARNGMESAMAARGLEPLTPPRSWPSPTVSWRPAPMSPERAATAGEPPAPAAGPGHPRFALLAPASAAPSPDARNALLSTLADLPEDEAVRKITDVITRLLAGVLQTDPADLDPTRNVTDHGLDSLLGMQFLVQARDLFDIRLGPADLATGRTPAHFARLIHQRLDLGA